tara:strand:+ start:364 stop:831 length:468 start_codon:yes stop_codon:yes gene_type:complete
MKKTAGIALVCIETCRVLFLEKAVGKSEGTWGFPGGTMDDGETFEEAMYRELDEETGISKGEVKDVRYLTDVHTGKKIFKLYIGEVDKEIIPTLSNEHSDYSWIDLNKFDILPDKNLNPINVALLPHIKNHVECKLETIQENYHILKWDFKRLID